MIKDGTGIGLSILKAMCVALTLLLVAGAFAAGAVTDSGCGVRCRCHHNPMNMDHSKGQSIPLSPDLCKGDPMIPCDLESSPASRLPEFIPGSGGVNLKSTTVAADMTIDCETDCPAFSGDTAYHPWRVKPRFAHLYLQNASFLI